MKKPGLLLIMFFLWPVCTLADTFQLVKIASGLGVPWGMTFISDDKMLFTERQGNLGILNVNSGLLEYIEGLPEIHVAGQGGLMDVATSPEYDSEGWLYFTYVKPMNNYGETTLARARLIDLHLTDWQDLLVTRSIEGDNKHFGSRIAFDGEFVYFSVGERGYRPNAQDLSTHAGSIIRLNLDGSTPEDNPFVNNNQALDEIWSYGHRNPQGLAVHPETGNVWLNEHGPQGGDELNLVQPGLNYGWPVIGYGVNYGSGTAIHAGTRGEGIESPAHFWVPSIATSGMMIYTGDRFPAWTGSFFVGGTAGQQLARLTPSIDQPQRIEQEETLTYGIGRVRDVRQGPDGYIYLAIDDRRGGPTAVVRLEPVPH